MTIDIDAEARRIAASVSNGNGHHPDIHPDNVFLHDDKQRSKGEEFRLPDEFWNARWYLDHIRRAAWARMESDEAVLHAVLARVAAAVPAWYSLPPLVGGVQGFTFYVALVGPSGIGKSSASKVACELLPVADHVADRLPLGSGEGFIECLFDMRDEVNPITGKSERRKIQVKNNAFFYCDEGTVLASIGGRQGATVLETLRSAWSREVVGQTNASTERKRKLDPGRYTYGLVAGFQPSVASALLDDAARGTPQRFTWAWAQDPNIPDQPPDWPGSIDWKPPMPPAGSITEHIGDFIQQNLDIAPQIRDEIRRARLGKHRNEIVVADLDGHAMLVRLKAAGLLAMLDNRFNISVEDWQLVGMLMERSDAVRAKVIDIISGEAARQEANTSAKYARRAVDAKRASEEDDIATCSRKIWKKVHAAPGNWGASELRRQLGARWRDPYPEALDRAIELGWIERRAEPGQGQDKIRLHPGQKRP